VLSNLSHLDLLMLGVLGLLLVGFGLGLFLRRILESFTDGQKAQSDLALKALAKQQQDLNDEAFRRRQQLLSAFLEQQRNRDEATFKAQEKTLATIRSEIESVATAQGYFNGRLRSLEEERIPRLEQRVRDVEGKVERLEHPSLKAR
jgi:hypothetical protein